MSHWVYVCVFVVVDWSTLDVVPVYVLPPEDNYVMHKSTGQNITIGCQVFLGPNYTNKVNDGPSSGWEGGYINIHVSPVHGGSQLTI